VIVADTCVVVWVATAPELLSPAAASAVRQARLSGGAAISGVTLYEVAWLSAHGRVKLLAPLAFVLSQIESNFVVLPVTSSIARLAAELPADFPGDPMDRIIGATALDRGVALITKDRAIRRSTALTVIW
jgi:PIN domain nuclease of toxin-antitoxin system